MATLVEVDKNNFRTPGHSGHLHTHPAIWRGFYLLQSITFPLYTSHKDSAIIFFLDHTHS